MCNLLIFATVFLILTACGNHDNTSPQIPTDLFIQIYVETIDASFDSTRTETTDFLAHTLTAHNLTRDEWDRNVEHYQKNPEVWFDIFSKVQEQLQDSTAIDSSKKRRLFQ